ncbi:MAG: hypothetical protein D6683_01950, partial [Actinomyces sp.]
MPETATTGELEAFADLVWQACDGWLVVTELPSRRSHWVPPGEGAPAIVAAVNACAPDQNVYIGVASRRHRTGSGRGKAGDCAELPALVVDVDRADGVHATELALPSTRADLDDLVARFPLAPTAVIDTGGGWHLWWVLDEPVATDDPATGELLERWGATWLRLGAETGWHLDNVWDVARIMRLPGTLNVKCDPPRPVHL